jgi:hypothetical protein
MNDDQFGDPVNGEWPMPVACIYCNHDNQAVRDLYCDVACMSCIRRHFSPPAPKPPKWWERFKLWLWGWNTDEA